MVRLGDVCTFQSGGTPSRSNSAYFDGTIPWITTVALNGSAIDEESAVEWITDLAISESAAKIVPANSIMVGTRVGVGKVAINKVSMSTSQDIISLLCIDETQWYKPFLCKFILAMGDYLNSQARGATIKGIKIDVLAALELPDMPIDQQRIIATVFDKIEALLSLRKQQLAKLDELVKSRFVEMFGDPVENDMNWQTEVLDSICSTIVDCPHSTPSYTAENTGYMCIRTSIVKKNHILWDQIEYIPEHEYRQRIQRKKPEKGDIVYTREGAILGIAAIIDRDCNVALGQRSMLLSPDTSKCLPQFLSTAMNFDSFLRKALGGISGSASAHINVGDIKAFSIIMPPIELQTQFATFVEQTDKSKFAVQQSIEKLETLKKSLMQQYFG